MEVERKQLLTGSLVPFLSLGARFRPCRQRVSSAWSEVRSSGHGYLEHLDSQDQVEVASLLVRLPLGTRGSTVGLAIGCRLDRIGALEAMQRQMRRQPWSRHCDGAMYVLSCCGQRSARGNDGSERRSCSCQQTPKRPLQRSRGEMMKCPLSFSL